MIIAQTERTSIEILAPDAAVLVRDYICSNRAHLSAWEPLRDETYFTLAVCQQRMESDLADAQAGELLHFWALNRQRTEIVACCCFSNITHGIFQACNLGYSVAEKYQGQGYMQEVLDAAIAHIFQVHGLHRIMANYMPANIRSERLLEKLGFEKEGYARSYLKIAGKWEDHILTSRINPHT